MGRKEATIWEVGEGGIGGREEEGWGVEERVVPYLSF